MKKLWIALAIVLMISAVFVSCVKKDVDNGAESSSQSVTTAESNGNGTTDTEKDSNSNTSDTSGSGDGEQTPDSGNADLPINDEGNINLPKVEF